MHTGQLFQMWVPAERPSATAEGPLCNLFDLPPLSPIFTAGICWGLWICTEWRIIIIMANSFYRPEACLSGGPGACNKNLIRAFLHSSRVLHAKPVGHKTAPLRSATLLRLHCYASLHQTHEAAAKFTMGHIAWRLKGFSFAAWRDKSGINDTGLSCFSPKVAKSSHSVNISLQAFN